MTVKGSESLNVDPTVSSHDEPTVPTPPPAPPVPPAPTPTPSPESPRESSNAVVKNLEALAALVETTLEHSREMEERHQAAHQTAVEDFQAAQSLMESKLGDMTELIDRCETITAALAKAVETFARNRQ